MSLEDFVGKSLHEWVERQDFKLRLHRIEVLRRPVTSPHPISPLREKYLASNFSLQGLEKKGVDDSNVEIDTDLQLKSICSEPTEAEVEAIEVIINNEIFS